MTAREILLAALELLREGWSRTERAEDEEGRAVIPWDVRARRWSPVGALLAVWRRVPRPSRSRPELRRAHLALRSVVGDVEAWNGAPERTLADVVAAFEKAVSLLDGETDPSLHAVA